MGGTTEVGAVEAVSKNHCQLVEATRRFVKHQLDNCPRDGSHDYWYAATLLHSTARNKQDIWMDMRFVAALHSNVGAVCRHIERVHAMAVTLAKEEGLEGESLLAVEMAALLHDVQDWKYEPTQEFSVKVSACHASLNHRLDTVATLDA